MALTSSNYYGHSLHLVPRNCILPPSIVTFSLTRVTLDNRYSHLVTIRLRHRLDRHASQPPDARECIQYCWVLSESFRPTVPTRDPWVFHLHFLQIHGSSSSFPETLIATNGPSVRREQLGRHHIAHSGMSLLRILLLVRSAWIEKDV